jgi:ferredoxin
MPSAEIYCFSATGNSLSVARRLAEAMGAPPPVSMAGESGTVRRPGGAAAREAAGIVGLVFPVYLHEAPRLVLEFIRRSSFGHAYVFAAATNNGEAGSCMRGGDSALRAAGSRLAAGFGILMPGNSVIIADLTNPPEVRARRLADSEAAVADIAARALAREENRDFRREGAVSLAKSRLFKAATRIYRLPSRFRSSEACSGCGACVRVCPRANVALERGRPAWGGDCEMCLACYHACPARAVDIEGCTRDRLRYRHPGVSLEDLYLR